ncbi:hypothetical protein ABZP36_015915 [Zizania latifolia]
MRSARICACFLSALVLLHCFLSSQTARAPGDDRTPQQRFLPRKLLQNVLIKSSSENARVFREAELIDDESSNKAGIDAADSLKKETQSKANPIHN